MAGMTPGGMAGGSCDCRSPASCHRRRPGTHSWSPLQSPMCRTLLSLPCRNGKLENRPNCSQNVLNKYTPSRQHTLFDNFFARLAFSFVATAGACVDAAVETLLAGGLAQDFSAALGVTTGPSTGTPSTNRSFGNQSKPLLN